MAKKKKENEKEIKKNSDEEDDESELEEDVDEEIEEIDDERFSEFMTSRRIETDRIAPTLNQVAVADEVPVPLETNIAQTPTEDAEEQIKYSAVISADEGRDYQSSSPASLTPTYDIQPTTQTKTQEFLNPMQGREIPAGTNMESELISEARVQQDNRTEFEKQTDSDRKYQTTKLDKKWV